MFKLNSLAVALFMFIGSNPLVANPAPNGTDRLKNIMFNTDTGIPTYNGNTEYAEVVNIAKDLDFSNLLPSFPCQIRWGKNCW